MEYIVHNVTIKIINQYKVKRLVIILLQMESK